MPLTLSDKVVRFLASRPEQQFTAREIAQWIFEKYPDESREKKARSTAKVTPLDSDNAVVQQIAAEIGSRRPQIQDNNPTIKTIETRPRKYYFTEQTDSAEINKAEKLTSDKESEHDLYPKLKDFLLSELNVYSGRVSESRSSNREKGANKWLHPDLVGMENNIAENWIPDIKRCVERSASNRAKLWSFEVKIKLNRSNVREAFFQAVSNSSWANFGYLVARDVEDVSTIKELQILSGLHGIGFIQLNSDNPSESEIKIPAKERFEVDWHVMNRLASENPDFRGYVNLVDFFYKSGSLPDQESKWDNLSENEPNG